MRASEKRRRVSVKATVRLDAYGILSDTVERAVAYAIRRHNKYADAKDTVSERQASALEDKLPGYIMDGLCEVLCFDNTDREV